MFYKLTILQRAAAGLALTLLLAACIPAEDTDSPEQRTAMPPTPSLSPSPTPLPVTSLPDLGPAPDITNEEWLNTDRPLNLAALRGKVVLVEFWTFG